METVAMLVQEVTMVTQTVWLVSAGNQAPPVTCVKTKQASVSVDLIMRDKTVSAVPLGSTDIQIVFVSLLHSLSTQSGLLTTQREKPF